MNRKQLLNRFRCCKNVVTREKLALFKFIVNSFLYFILTLVLYLHLMFEWCCLNTTWHTLEDFGTLSLCIVPEFGNVGFHKITNYTVSHPSLSFSKSQLLPILLINPSLHPQLKAVFPFLVPVLHFCLRSKAFFILHCLASILVQSHLICPSSPQPSFLFHFSHSHFILAPCS